MKNSSAALAWGGVLLAGALWGGGALVAQQLLDAGMAPASLALARFALGLPLLWVGAHWAGRAAPQGRVTAAWRELPWRVKGLVAGTGAAMALNVGCWFVAITYMGAALPTVISICCAPVLVAAISALRGYERVSAPLLACLGAALLGTALVVAPSGGGPLPAVQWLGVAWSLGSAAMYALVVLGNARMPRTVSPLVASAWGMTAATLCAGAVAVVQGVTWPQGAWQWAGAGYTGVVTTAIAYVAFAWSARRLGPTAAVVGTLVEPLVAAVLAVCLLGESMGTWQLVGAGLLCASIVGMSRRG
jgi:DME family drug/metabolite transporter